DGGGDGARHVVQRPERPRREQGLAAAPGDIEAAARAPLELLEQRGLADPGLAADQGDGAAAGSGALGQRLQLIEEFVALEEHGVPLPRAMHRLCVYDGCALSLPQSIAEAA